MGSLLAQHQRGCHTAPASPLSSAKKFNLDDSYPLDRSVSLCATVDAAETDADSGSATSAGETSGRQNFATHVAEVACTEDRIDDHVDGTVEDEAASKFDDKPMESILCFNKGVVLAQSDVFERKADEAAEREWRSAAERSWDDTPFTAPSSNSTATNVVSQALRGFRLRDVTSDSMTLSIWVKNIAFEKKVFVRITEDGWKTQKDVMAMYAAVSPSDTCCPLYQPDDTDMFIAVVPFSKADHQLDFCVGYFVNGEEYWDNNGGKNYGAEVTLIPECELIQDSTHLHLNSESCTFCSQVAVQHGSCDICNEPNKTLFQTTNAWASEYWIAEGCRDSACRECLLQWYRTHIADGAKVIPCIFQCGARAKPPDVHVIDRLLALSFVHNINSSCKDHVQNMMNDGELASWLSNNTVLCPWCTTPIERESGCNMMLCHCGCLFCYECKGVLDENDMCECEGDYY